MLGGLRWAVSKKVKQLADGLGRLIDIGGVTFKVSHEKSPRVVIYADWKQVGDDLRAAMDEAAEELPEAARRQLSEELVEAK